MDKETEIRMLSQAFHYWLKTLSNYGIDVDSAALVIECKNDISVVYDAENDDAAANLFRFGRGALGSYERSGFERNVKK